MTAAVLGNISPAAFFKQGSCADLRAHVNERDGLLCLRAATKPNVYVRFCSYYSLSLLLIIKKLKKLYIELLMECGFIIQVLECEVLSAVSEIVILNEKLICSQ